jgi:DNA polymerase-3 subunit gamma/tau
MEEYIVSARKYRPTHFSTVVGQEALTTTLKNAIANKKLAHAYLFCGPRGVGKTTCARIFAKTINCLSPDANGDPCEQCESCVAFNEQRSYNIHELDAASNNSVEDIRQLIDQVRVPPQIGQYKVFIIDEVHMLSTQAFNAFLKTLEEPPAHAIFILATTEKHKILPTILSRCQVYDFNRMSVQNIVNHLKGVAEKEGYEYDMNALNVIAQKADGGMRDALSIFDQVVSFTQGHLLYDKVIENLNVLSYEYYFRLTDAFLGNRVPEVMLTFNEILNKGFDAANFMTGLAEHLRNLLVSRDEVTLPLLEVSEDARNKYREQAQKCPPKFLYRAIKLCNNYDVNYRTARNKRLLTEITLIQLAQVTQEDEPGSGRCPEDILKPIFKQILATVRTTAAPSASPASSAAKVTTNTVAAGGVRPLNTAGGQVAGNQVAGGQRTSTGTGTTGASSSPATEGMSSPTASAASRPLPKLRRVSLRSKTQATTGAANAAVQEVEIGEDAFTQEALRIHWFEYVDQLPREETALAARMQNTFPDLKENCAFEIKVNSQRIADDLNHLRGDLEGWLRRKLNNRHVHMDITVLTTEEQAPTLTHGEQFAEMIKKNEGIRKLYEALKLELM